MGCGDGVDDGRKWGYGFLGLRRPKNLVLVRCIGEDIDPSQDAGAEGNQSIIGSAVEEVQYAGHFIMDWTLVFKCCRFFCCS